MLKNLIILGIFTVITVLVWIGLDVYHNGTTSTVSEDTTKTIIPITPTFDQEAVSIIEKREQLPVDLDGGPQVATGTAQKIPTPTSASPSAQISRVSPTPKITLTP